MEPLRPGSGGLRAALPLLAAAALPAIASCQERPAEEEPPGADGEEARVEGSFEEGVHDSPHGTRRYRLFVPEGATGPTPLLVMLHGCTQDARDFARGTRMNQRAGARGWMVLYPEQPADAHPQRCWNWYLEDHQTAEGGEPALLGSMIESVRASREADPERVYVAGVSAGGAMAQILGASFPERFAAVASHSGVPYGAGRGQAEALDVMEGGGAPVSELARRLRSALGGSDPPPLVLVHGSADGAVDASNSRRAAAAWWLAGEGDPSPRPATPSDAAAGPGADGAPDLDALLPPPAVATTGTSDGGLEWTRRTWQRADGAPDLELWLVEGLGHAWSGGDPAGSYAEPHGPDASQIVVDFFARVAGDRRGVDDPPYDGERR